MITIPRIHAKSSSYMFSSPTNTNKSTPQSSSSPKRNDLSLVKNNGKRATRRLITISTSDGRWQGSWNCDYVFSLRDLHLQDLAGGNHHDARVSVSLCIHKHTGFGLSVDGRVTTTFTRICRKCFSPYCREIDEKFNVWVLPSRPKTSAQELPLIGWEDPSVIYVKPGDQADLDSLVQDTLRLATSGKETCSESCEKSERKLQSLGKRNSASIDRRWSRLLELKNAGL